MRLLLVEGLVFGNIYGIKLAKATAKDLCQGFTSSFPPPKVIFKFDIEWTLLYWINWPGISCYWLSTTLSPTDKYFPVLEVITNSNMIVRIQGHQGVNASLVQKCVDLVLFGDSSSASVDLCSALRALHCPARIPGPVSEAKPFQGIPAALLAKRVNSPC